MEFAERENDTGYFFGLEDDAAEATSLYIPGHVHIMYTPITYVARPYIGHHGWYILCTL